MQVAPGGQLLRLAPEPASVGLARRFVHAALLEAGHPEWVDAAELAVSEIVTNVVLHADTPANVRVMVADTHLSVEVHDFSSAAPHLKRHTVEATTGRGLELLAAVAAQHGIRWGDGVGKTVWFVIGDAPHETATASASGWELAQAARRGGVRQHHGPREEALLERLPGKLWLAALEAWAAVLRELYLYLPQNPTGADVSALDLASAGRALNTLCTSTDVALAKVQRTSGVASGIGVGAGGGPAAAHEVSVFLDLSVPLGREDGRAFAALQDALDVGRRLARSGRLLAAPTLPEVRALRDWACEQVIAQLAGVAPTPWRASVGVDEDSQLPAVPGWHDHVSGAPVALVAADESDRFIAVSASAAELLGWDVATLLGRRLTTIMPARLREQHVAAFTSHLATGRDRLLGVELRLPVLHAEGHEIPCRVLINRDSTSRGRVVYVASFTLDAGPHSIPTTPGA